MPSERCGGRCRCLQSGRGRGGFALRRGGANPPTAFYRNFAVFKTEAAHHTRRAVGGNPSGFDSNRAAAAKRVLKRLRAVVACREQQPGGKVFAQRGFAGIQAVAAFEQGFARSVDEDFDIAFVQKGVDADIGRGFVHARTCVVNVAESVADGIFDGQVEANWRL